VRHSRRGRTALGRAGAEEAPIDVAGLFREHKAALLRFAAAKLGSEHEAREVAQEAYVRLLRLDHRQTIGFLCAYSLQDGGQSRDRLLQEWMRWMEASESHRRALSM
jgi:hypothetical protein